MLGYRFVRYLLMIATIVALTLGLLYRQSAQQRLSELAQAEEKYVALLSDALAEDFRAVITDLHVLADSGELHQMLDEPTTENRRLALEAFRRYVERKRVYDQIRLLDLNGKESIRVNYHDGRPEIVSDELLQLKQDRYYFQEALKLSLGQVFVSPLDLNVEDGKIEQPVKPTMRFATPVTNSLGQRQAILVLNYLGRVLLNRFSRLDSDSPGQAMLLNSDGYWLYDAERTREWGFMYDERKDQHFGGIYPQVWQQLHATPRGRVHTSEGLFSFSIVQPFQPRRRSGTEDFALQAVPGARHTWYVVSRLPTTAISQHLAGLRRGMSILSMLLLAMAVGASWVLAKFAVARDTSEQALRASENRFRQMAASIAEVFWMSTVDRNTLLYVSPAFDKIWGQHADSLEEARRLWRASIHPDDRDQAEEAINGTTNPDGYSVQYRIVRRDGSTRWIWDQGFPVRNQQQQIISYAGIAEDITALRDAQQQLLQNARLAAIGEAITGLAHESRNALQRSQACLEMLGKRVADRPEASDLVARTGRALVDLQRLYERVRCYAAPLQLQFDPCDLREIWQQTCEDLAETIASRHASVTQVNATRGPTETQVVADATAIRQVFRNILENALAPELDAGADRHQVKVEVSWREFDWDGRPAVEVIIHDNGSGCPAGIQERIFEPFFTTKTQGTGLGMAICRRIVEAHDGAIYASCNGNSGLQVTIQLPKVRT